MRLTGLCLAIALVGPTPGANAAPPAPVPSASLLVSGLAGSWGSTVGPDGALYVTEAAAGRVSRVDPDTGDVTLFASGLPPWILGIGGAVDVAFLDGRAYVLVTLVGADVGGTDVVGVYRVDGPTDFTIVADIGAFAMAHPPDTDFFVPTGVQYAMEAFQGALLVTDGHHNRVLRVTADGQILVWRAFDNIVPTGLETWGHTVLMAEAGPIPHLPENGRAVAIDAKTSASALVATGAPLLVDVEFGPGRALFGLAQGEWPLGGDPGSPAYPFTGKLMRADASGTFVSLVDGLNLPTSLEFIGTTAYVVGLAGEVWKIENAAGAPPYGVSY